MKIRTLRVNAEGLNTIIGLILCFCLLDIVHTYIGGVGEGRQLTWAYVLVGVPEFWITYFLALPLAITLARRYRPDLHRPSTWLPHIIGALVFAYFHILLVASVPFPALNPQSTFTHRLFFIMRVNFAADYLTYWAILGATYIARHYSELQQRQVAEARLEASLVQAHLQALQAQLRPHFFFNTLQAVSVLALKGDKDGVVETLGHLAHLLRVASDAKRPQKIALASELEFLDEYLAIQQLSLGDRFRVDREIEGDALTALVPSMLLQPIVENAIVHGIASRQGPGAIEIRAARAERWLQLWVNDSGPGFQEILPRDGVGLANTRERLQQLYDVEFRLEFEHSRAGGASVKIVIPFEQWHDAVPDQEAASA